MNKNSTHPGRLMSYAMTTPQIERREKLVTRRDGWLNLKVGEVYWAVEKAMGLKRGEKVKRLHLLQCVSVRRERLYKMIEDTTYGKGECILEGFADMEPLDFVNMYVNAKRGRHAGDEISRIEFRYLIQVFPQYVQPISIPPHVAGCHGCDSGIWAYPQTYYYLPDGTLGCNRFAVDCEIHGGLDTPSLNTKVSKYLTATFRFEAE